ncbi:hypothetical protein B9J07_27130 [Sinorhizobium sp. LM21]|nr:hypothetical protein B9J07_27130 [Sinorhizobium sp. LM21]
MTFASDIPLALLFQRLSWPIGMVRWRAARAIRELLANEPTRTPATQALLSFLKGRRTESEVCSILSVLTVTNEKHRPDIDDVVGRIGCPSILADVLLDSLYGEGAALGGWETAHSGDPPLGFQPDAYFMEQKGAHLPPNFYNRLIRLERNTGLPFVDQWAWEWQSLCAALGTKFTRYANYFGDVSEARAGIVGQYHQRQTEVFRSAFIRTFAYAVTTWGMPLESAVGYLIDHVPAVGGLFDLELNRKPDCLGNIPALCVKEHSDLKGIVAEWVRENRLKDMPCVSLVSPLPAEEARYGDVYLGAFLVTPDFELRDDRGLFEPMTLTQLGTRLSVDGFIQDIELAELKENGKVGWAAPVCSSLLSKPYGYWTADLFSIGMPVVAPYCLPGPARIRAADGTLRLVDREATLASTLLWNDVWTPNHPKGGSTRCGAVAQLSRKLFCALPGSVDADLKLAWFIQTRVWKREKYGDFELIERRDLVLDEAI